MRGSAACRSFRRTTVSAASGTTKRPAGDPGRREAAKGPLDPPRLFKHARRESSKFHGRSMRVFSFTATLPKVIPSGWVGGGSEQLGSRACSWRKQKELSLDSKQARRESLKLYGRDMRVFSSTSNVPKVIPRGRVGGVDSMIRGSRMARGASPVWNPKSRRLRHARRRFSGRTLLSVCNPSLRAVGNPLGPSGHPQTLPKYAKTPPKRSN